MQADAIRIYRNLLLQEDALKQAGSWYGNQRTTTSRRPDKGWTGR